MDYSIIFVCLMGMGTVFFGLICLIVLTTLLGRVCGQKQQAAPAAAAVPAPAAAPAGAGKEVLSPLEGKFYLVKNTSETPVKVGDVVKEGDVLCYVEAMKTYNAVRAEFGGTITSICLSSGDAVSEDDLLMTIQ